MACISPSLTLKAPRLGVALALAVASACGAATPIRAPVLQALIDCRTVADASARLACFDKNIAIVQDSERRGDVITIDREQRREVRRQAFGLTLPALAMFDRGEPRQEADRLTAPVADAYQSPSARWIIKLEGGATWRQIDDSELFAKPHHGSIATIRRGSLGSFFMEIDKERGIRVHRDN